MKPLRVAAAAEEELQAAVAWYEGRRPNLGLRFLSDVDRILNLIQTHSGVGGLVPHVRSRPEVRRVPLRRFPYFVIYREQEDEIQIVAFAHSSRRPGYWRHRNS